VRWLFLIFIAALAGCAASVGATDGAARRSYHAGADPLAEGQKLYVAKCAKCHKFYDPANYSDREWKIWMGKMSKKAKLKPEQQVAVSDYIEKVLRAPK